MNLYPDEPTRFFKRDSLEAFVKYLKGNNGSSLTDTGAGRPVGCHRVIGVNQLGLRRFDYSITNKRT